MNAIDLHLLLCTSQKCNPAEKQKLKKKQITLILKITAQQLLRDACFGEIVDTHLKHLKQIFCFKCFKQEHFLKMCRSIQVFKKSKNSTNASLMKLSTMSHFQVNIKVLINGIKANVLLDTGSNLSHLSYKFRPGISINRSTG